MGGAPSKTKAKALMKRTPAEVRSMETRKLQIQEQQGQAISINGAQSSAMINNFRTVAKRPQNNNFLLDSPREGLAIESAPSIAGGVSEEEDDDGRGELQSGFGAAAASTTESQMNEPFNPPAIMRADNVNSTRRFLEQSRRKKTGGPLMWQGSPFTKLAMSSRFQNFILFVITINAFWIGANVDLKDEEMEANGEYGSPSPWQIGELIFTGIFVFEIVIRFLAYMRPWYFFTDDQMSFWNAFDFVLASIMVMENIVMPMIAPGNNIFNKLIVLRLVRLLRLSRVVRSIPELKMLIVSMLGAFRSVSATFLLIAGVVYVFAIIFTEWSKGRRKEEMTSLQEQELYYYYGNLGWSALTMVQLLTFESPMYLVRITMDLSPGWGGVWILLFAFQFIASYTIINMLIGVIVAIVQGSQEEQEEKVLLENMCNLFTELDADGDGQISIDEFEQQGSLFAKIGMDVQTCAMAYELADTHGKGEIAIEELVDTLFKLLHPPQAQDVMIMGRNIHHLCQQMGVSTYVHHYDAKAAGNGKISVQKPEFVLFTDQVEEMLDNKFQQYFSGGGRPAMPSSPPPKKVEPKTPSISGLPNVPQAKSQATPLGRVGQPGRAAAKPPAYVNPGGGYKAAAKFGPGWSPVVNAEIRTE